MGLNKAQMLVWVEDAFGISIEPHEAADLETVGDLRDLVQAKLAALTPRHGWQAGRCLSSHAFYRLRRAFVEVCGVERRQVSPTTSADDLLPREGRRRLWKDLAAHAGLPLPGMHPSAVTFLALLFGVPLSVAMVLFAHHAGMSVAPPAVLAGILLAGTWYRVSPTAPAETVGDLVRLTFMAGYGSIAREGKAWSHREVEETVCAIVGVSAGFALSDGAGISPADSLEEWGLR